MSLKEIELKTSRKYKNLLTNFTVSCSSGKNQTLQITPRTFSQTHLHPPITSVSRCAKVANLSPSLHRTIHPSMIDFSLLFSLFSLTHSHHSSWTMRYDLEEEEKTIKGFYALKEEQSFSSFLDFHTFPLAGAHEIVIPFFDIFPHPFSSHFFPYCLLLWNCSNEISVFKIQCRF